MLGLQCATNAEWIESVEAHPEGVLSDHAHCERKAATMAISLITRYPERRELVEAMAGLAQEEMEHFASVARTIFERGYTLTRDPGDAYAQSLHELIRKQEPARLLDTLLVSSIIEARSCERFQLLAVNGPDEELKHFYRSLLESEAGHRMLFIRLANLYFPQPIVTARLSELNALEAEIVRSLHSSPTMHG